MLPGSTLVIRNSLIMVEAEIADFENGAPSTGREDNTKSRRKRRKKKKKKSGNNSTVGSVESESDDDSSDDAFLSPSKTRNNKNGDDANHTTTAASSIMSTPQEIARHRLIDEDGFEASRVDSAMEEMWNKGLPYDDYGAILSYLMDDISETIEEPNTIFSAPTLVSATHKADESATETTELDSNPSQPDSPGMMCMSDDKVTENGDTPITTEGTNDENNNTDNDTIEEEEEDDSEEEDDDDESEYESDDEYEDQAPAAPPITMAEKLDIVAGFENLTDAIFALTQWVNKAAKLEDVSDLWSLFIALLDFFSFFSAHDDFMSLSRIFRNAGSGRRSLHGRKNHGPSNSGEAWNIVRSRGFHHFRKCCSAGSSAIDLWRLGSMRSGGRNG